jgi:hypothetical protein
LAKPLADWLFSVAQHDDLFPAEVKTGLPELTSAAPLPQRPRRIFFHSSGNSASREAPLANGRPTAEESMRVCR